MSWDELKNGRLEELDPELARVLERERARQEGRLILIASESQAPGAVLECLSTELNNIYAEGWPRARSLREERGNFGDVARSLAVHGRYADRRYYRGCEMADLVESLAIERAEELFACLRPVHANVQPLSGSAANNAVFTALLSPGDAIMGMDLQSGGHLTHGAPVSRSGMTYEVASYSADRETGRIDPDAVLRLAREARPRLVIAGASSYPYEIDWELFRKAADISGGHLLADVAHTAGLIAAGVHKNPLEFADVMTFTTHKTLCGPRGAVVMCRDELASRIDRGVFPGEQGGPHMHQIAAKAVCFAVARTETFRELMRLVVDDARALGEELRSRGLKLAFGGTRNHLIVLDLEPSGLDGCSASRLLDAAGLVSNEEMLPGDESPRKPSGLRLGTVWAAQRGLKPDDMAAVAEVIVDVVSEARPARYPGRGDDVWRARLPWKAVERARARVRELVGKEGPESPRGLRIRGPRDIVESFLEESFTGSARALAEGESSRGSFLQPDGSELAGAAVTRTAGDEFVASPADAKLASWLRSLSDGTLLAHDDPNIKVAGPVAIEACGPVEGRESKAGARKFFIVGRKIEFTPPEYEPPAPRKKVLTAALASEHERLGAKMGEFAGWRMPLWYSSVTEEHAAVRERSGAFDIGHMAPIGISGGRGGGDACLLLDLATTIVARSLSPGTSRYGFLLEPGGAVIDDVVLYRRAREKFLLVSNAANSAAVLAWLEKLARHFELRAEVTDLRSEGLTLLSLQGPLSAEHLARAGGGGGEGEGEGEELSFMRIRKGEHAEMELLGAPAFVARTGYTGERIGFELVLPSEEAAELWRKLIEDGAGAAACGLGARDSLRTEAGLPLHGHELAGPLKLSAFEAGLGRFVSLGKGVYVGRSRAREEWERGPSRKLARFHLPRGERPVRHMDLVTDSRGRVAGRVTSCTFLPGGLQTGMAAVDARAEEAHLRVLPGTAKKEGEAFPLPAKAEFEMERNGKVGS